MRERLLDTAVQLLSRGTTPLSTKAIADAAHVSVGTVYRYFNDCDEILGVLHEGMIREVYNDLATAVGAALGLELDASTVVVVEALTSSFERHAPVLRAVIERGADTGLMRGVEDTLFALARVIPARHRPDLIERGARRPRLCHDGVYRKRVPANRAGTPAERRPRGDDRRHRPHARRRTPAPG